MLISNFGVNYKGKPYMEALSTNKGLMIVLVASATLTAMLAGGALPELYAYIELAPLPTEELLTDLMGLMGLDFFGCYAIEWVAAKLARF